MKGGRSVKDRIKNILLLVGIIVFVYIVFYILKPDRFGSMSSILMLVQQSFMPSVAACGYFFAYTIGLFDLSMGANIILSALVGCTLSLRFGYAGLLLGCAATGVIIGLVNGVVSLRLKIPAVVATVGMLIIYECFGYYITIVAGGQNTLTLDPSLRAFGGLPWNVVLALLSFITCHILYKYSRLGLYANAIGTNTNLAKSMGINSEKWLLIASVVGGLFVGIMSILTISYGSTLSPALNMESFKRGFTPIMGCFLGVAMKKYVSPIIAIILGEFLLYLLMNGLITVGIDATMQDVVEGSVLLIVVCLTMHSSRYAEVR